jgi:hypothetical protein
MCTLLSLRAMVIHPMVCTLRRLRALTLHPTSPDQGTRATSMTSSALATRRRRNLHQDVTTTTAMERTVALGSSKDGKICYDCFMLQMYCAKHRGRFHHQFIIKVGFLGLFEPC